MSGETILAEVAEQTGQDVTYIARREDVAAYLATIVRPGDLVMTMGAGNICEAGPELLALLEKK